MYRYFIRDKSNWFYSNHDMDRQYPKCLAAFSEQSTALGQLYPGHYFYLWSPCGKTSVPTLKSNPQPTVSFTSAAIIVPANTQQVAKTLTDFSHYVGLFPTPKSAKTIEQSGNHLVKYKVSNSNTNSLYSISMRTSPCNTRSSRTASPVWSLMLPIPYGVGKLEWFALDEHRTLVTSPSGVI